MGCRTQINNLQLTNDLSIFQSLNLYKIQKTVLIKKVINESICLSPFINNDGWLSSEVIIHDRLWLYAE